MAETSLNTAYKPAFFGQKGSLEVRLARTPAEIEASQRLRYQVFYEEMSARPDAKTLATRRDQDNFDEICDHLLVIDQSLCGRLSYSGAASASVPARAVVGTYRLLRQDVAEAHDGFYTSREYNIAPLLARRGDGCHFLELGRSCVLTEYRTKQTLELLWHGIIQYLLQHNLDVMFGCASFAGTNPEQLALPLSYLAQNFAPPPEWHVRARDELYVKMNRIPADRLDIKAALRQIPPLIKGYVRAGAFIGEGAVVDHQFGTTDVLIIFPLAHANDRYKARFVQEKQQAISEKQKLIA